MIGKFLTFLLLLTFCLGSYDQGVARDLAYYSHFTYSLTSLSNWKCDYCNQYPLTDQVEIGGKSKSFFGFMGYSSRLDAIVIAFRGTANVQNVAVDLNYDQVSYPSVPGAKVHKTFYQSYLKLKNQITQGMAQLNTKYPHKKIYITGHSLGGALALFAAVELSLNYAVTAVYTYGQPRVGNQQFADYTDKHIVLYRVVNNNDPIPSLPPKQSPLVQAANTLKQVGNTIKEGAKNSGKKISEGGKKIGNTAKEAGKKAYSAVKKAFHFKSLSLHDSTSLQGHESYIKFSFRHSGHQIWYVKDAKTYYFCGSEDPKCHNSTPAIKRNPLNHLLPNYMKLLDTAIKNNWSHQLALTAQQHQLLKTLTHE